MTKRDLIPLGGGLVIGLLIGIVLAGAGILSLGGSAVYPPPADYYQIKMSDVATWLTEQYADSTEVTDSFNNALTAVNNLTAVVDIQKSFLASKTSVDGMLMGVYGALTGTKVTAADLQALSAAAPPDAEAAAAGPEVNKVSVCLALDDNPYSIEGPAMYLYITVPADQKNKVTVPNTWQSLKEPKTADLFWLLLSCYVKPDEA